MPPRKKVLRKGHSKRIKRFEEEIDDFGLDPNSMISVEELIAERRHLMAATFTACLTLLFWIIAVGKFSTTTSKIRLLPPQNKKRRRSNVKDGF